MNALGSLLEPIPIGIYTVLLDRDRLKTDVQDCPRIQGLAELVELVQKTSEGLS